MTAQWQPIGTAPKDGTAIIVAIRGEGGPVVTAYWQDDVWFTGWMVWSCRSDGWQVGPTHWQPLPDPPGDAA